MFQTSSGSKIDVGLLSSRFNPMAVDKALLAIVVCPAAKELTAVLVSSGTVPSLSMGCGSDSNSLKPSACVASPVACIFVFLRLKQYFRLQSSECIRTSP